METHEIGLIVVSIVLTKVVLWAVWVTQQLFTLKTGLALNTQRDEEVKSLIEKVNTTLGKVEQALTDITLALAENGISVKKN